MSFLVQCFHGNIAVLWWQNSAKTVIVLTFRGDCSLVLVFELWCFRDLFFSKCSKMFILLSLGLGLRRCIEFLEKILWLIQLKLDCITWASSPGKRYILRKFANAHALSNITNITRDPRIVQSFRSQTNV